VFDKATFHDRLGAPRHWVKGPARPRGVGGPLGGRGASTAIGGTSMAIAKA
jgi:hypothetical protein